MEINYISKSIAIICLFISSCMVDDIAENKGVAVAQITSSNKDYREWAFFLYYTYKIDGKIYNGESSRKVNGKYLNEYMFKYFPIVYSKINPEKSILLVSPDDFKRWEIQFPDSLNWIKDKLKY